MKRKEQLDLGETFNLTKTEHIPSNVQADSLFTFMTELEYLTSCIKNKMISARYCDENIEYLGINKIKIPSKALLAPFLFMCFFNKQMLLFQLKSCWDI